MTLTHTLLEHLQALEMSLHKPETLGDPARLSELLHTDFFEIGRSGQRYSRADILAELESGLHGADIESSDYALAEVVDGITLLSYTTAHVNVAGRKSRQTRRTSMWQRTEQGWKLRFHQGTPQPSVSARGS